MADRAFKLPDIDDLTKEQDAIIDLPLEGQYLIVGGPGTGKSVVALIRARRLARQEQDYVCLAYNKTLLKSNKQLFGEGLKSQQWQSWFGKVYKEHTGEFLPRKQQATSSFNPIHWDKVSKKTTELSEQYAEQPYLNDEQKPSLQSNDEHRANPDIDRKEGVFKDNNQQDNNHQAQVLPSNEMADIFRQTLIIDEGQDMPPDFYSALIDLFYSNFFVVADQNQQIKEDCSSIKELRALMNLDPEAVFKLTANWRNSYEIARFSRHFYTDKASPPPELPDPNTRSNGNIPLLYCYAPNNFDTMIDHIMIQAKDNDHKLIGIICPSSAIADKYFKALLSARDNKTDYQDIEINQYKSGMKRVKIDFGQGGIFVINAHSCKGLEFDTVFLADIDAHYAPGGSDALKKRFYVMASRARDKLFLLREIGSDTKLIDYILPDDDTLVR